jgi:hippurate hydrolase
MTSQPVISSTSLTSDDRRVLTALRRELHRYPELSFQEFETQRRLEETLLACGISDVQRVARTGLVARVPGLDPSAPVVALRGDIDALPIAEATGLEFASARPGVMHACGHDVHASWAVGAALLIARTPCAGEVRVILQPAEEIGLGAPEILASGALDGVAAIFGGHVDRRYPVGTVVAQAGPLAASTDTFGITLHGSGAHGARPHESHDPIVAAAALVMALQTIVSRRLDPALPGVVSIGTLQAGSASNIIPDRAVLVGTIRATTRETRDMIVSEIERIAHGVGAAHHVRADVLLTEHSPPIVNDERSAAWAVQAATDVLGPDALRPLGTVNMGGEDFAFYLERMPGCFLRIGAREENGALTPAHSPFYFPAEEALFVGAEVLAQCARVASHELHTNAQRALSGRLA